MAYIYFVYKQSTSCQLPFCASPIFHYEIGDFSVYNSVVQGGGETKFTGEKCPPLQIECRQLTTCYPMCE